MDRIHGAVGHAEYSVSQLGIGVVHNPLARPTEAQVTVGAGSISAGIVVVQTAWVDGRGNEGALSPLVPVTLHDSSSITVEIADGVNQSPASASGWNVYIGWDGADPSARIWRLSRRANPGRRQRQASSPVLRLLMGKNRNSTLWIHTS